MIFTAAVAALVAAGSSAVAGMAKTGKSGSKKRDANVPGLVRRPDVFEEDDHDDLGGEATATSAAASTAAASTATASGGGAASSFATFAAASGGAVAVTTIKKPRTNSSPTAGEDRLMVVDMTSKSVPSSAKSPSAKAATLKSPVPPSPLAKYCPSNPAGEAGRVSRDVWPRPATTDKIKQLLNSKEAISQIDAIFADETLDDTNAVATVDSILKDVDGWLDIIYELVVTFPGMIILIWIRTSPDEIIYEIIDFLGDAEDQEQDQPDWALSDQFSKNHSQIMRAYATFHLRSKEPGAVPMLCFPIRFELEGGEGREAHKSEEWAALCETAKKLKAVAATLGIDPKVSGQTSEFNRLNRIPEKALEMMGEAGVPFQFDKHGSSPEFIKEYARQYAICVDTLSVLSDDADHIDPAKGLKKKWNQEKKDAQKAIESKAAELKEEFKDGKSPFRARAEKAETAGINLFNSSTSVGTPPADEFIVRDCGKNQKGYSTSYAALAIETAFAELIENPNAGEEKARAFIKDHATYYPVAEEKDTHLFFGRTSPAALGNVERVTTLSKALSKDTVGFSLHQVACGFAFLDRATKEFDVVVADDDELGEGKEKLLSVDDVVAILSVISKRERVTPLAEIIVIVEMIMRKKLKSLIVTYTTRLSTHKGWIVFLNYLCKANGVAFRQSLAFACKANEVAEKEDARSKAIKEARKVLRDMSRSEDGTLEGDARTISMSMVK